MFLVAYLFMSAADVIWFDVIVIFCDSACWLGRWQTGRALNHWSMASTTQRTYRPL